MSKKFDNSKHPRIYFPSKRESINRVEIGRDHSIVASSSINGSDETPGYELSSLSHIRLIRNGGT